MFFGRYLFQKEGVESLISDQCQSKGTVFITYIYYRGVKATHSPISEAAMLQCVLPPSKIGEVDAVLDKQVGLAPYCRRQGAYGGEDVWQEQPGLHQ